MSSYLAQLDERQRYRRKNGEDDAQPEEFSPAAATVRVDERRE